MAVLHLLDELAVPQAVIEVLQVRQRLHFKLVIGSHRLGGLIGRTTGGRVQVVDRNGVQFDDDAVDLNGPNLAQGDVQGAFDAALFVKVR